MSYYATEGIKYIFSTLHLLDTLYYFAAAAAHELNQIDSRNNYLKKCYILLMIDENRLKQQRFKQIFKDRFNVDVNGLLQEKPNNKKAAHIKLICAAFSSIKLFIILVI